MRSQLKLLLGALAMVFLVAACGGDDTSGEAAGDANAQSVDDGGRQDADDSNDDVAEETIAYRVTGPDGSVVEVAQRLFMPGASDDEFQQNNQRFNMDGSTQGIVFTNFFDRAELEVTVTEGGPVTVEGFRTPYDPDANPFGDFDAIEVAESLVTVEVAAGATETVTFP